MQRRRIDVAGSEWGEARAFARHETRDVDYRLTAEYVRFHDAVLDWCLGYRLSVSLPAHPLALFQARLAEEPARPTEAEASRRVRIDQDVFRAALLNYWGGACPLTGISEAPLLRASHIRPWAECDDAERLDVHNGLLLSALWDAAFDRGLVSFSGDGRALFAPTLGNATRRALGAGRSPRPSPASSRSMAHASPTTDGGTASRPSRAGPDRHDAPPSPQPSMASILANRRACSAAEGCATCGRDDRSRSRRIKSGQRPAQDASMPGPTFHTNPVFLSDLLRKCHDGHLQLPDFQRSWVWDEDRIKGLIASISRAFPVGALMTLDTGGVAFKPRPIEGASARIRPEAAQALLLDGQQRMTSMYQVTLRGEIVRTITAKRKPAERWFYIDIRKSIAPDIDREEAIVTVSKDRRYTDAEGRTYNLEQPEAEFEALLFPLTQAFSWNDWQMRLMSHAIAAGRQAALWPTIIRFHDEVIKNFEQYRVPVIALSAETSKEAVCTVFEKVNTGGKALDAFELVTAMFAADGHELRKDWYGKGAEKGRRHRLGEMLRHGDQRPGEGILSGVANTDFLQAVSLFHTRQRRREAAAGRPGKDLPAVLATRAALLDLPLDAYKRYQDRVEQGFVRAAKFLHRLHIYRVFDLPYQSQVVPLAAVLADVEHALDHQSHFAKLAQWYWCGVFGELYGSATESRIARDFLEVPAWLAGGEAPSTVREATFRAERLKTMRMRLSAAYKGMNALLMDEGAQDWRSGLPFDHAVFFGEAVDIHHIFPRAWCLARNIKPERFDSIINKTPLAALTNKIIGGAAPSAYLRKLKIGGNGAPPILADTLDGHLASHRIAPHLLRADDFDGFMADRQASLLKLIEAAMGKAAHQDAAGPSDEAEADDEAVEAGLVMEAAA